MSFRAAAMVLPSMLLAGCAAAASSAPPGAGEGKTWTVAPATTPLGAVAASPSTSTPSTSTPATSASTLSDSASTADPASVVTLAFAGDVHFERQVASLLEDSDETWASRLPELAEADFAMVNLETAITDRGARAAKKYTFRTSPVALNKLRAAGVDAVTLANNHAADFGRQGVEDTLAATAKSPIPVIGFGPNEKEAYAPVTFDVKGVNVAVLSSMEIPEETYANWSAGPDSAGVAQNVERDRFTRAARDAVASHDLVVTFLHWGTEGSTCPNDRQAETARILRDAGVDVIVGTHAHRPQGSGWNGRAFVGYGMGNFIWYNTSADSRSSGVLTVTVDGAAARDRGRQDPATRASGPSLVRSYAWKPKLISGGGVPEDPTLSKTRLDRAAQHAESCAGLEQSPR